MRGRGFSWLGRQYAPLATPARGAHWSVALRHSNDTSSGPFEHLDLTLRTDGTVSYVRRTFARTSEPGALPRNRGGLPEGSGIYRVEPGGHLVLRYRSGRVARRALGVLTDRAAGPTRGTRG